MTSGQATQEQGFTAVVEAPSGGAVSVATEVHRPGAVPIRCAAGPLLAGSLRRAGVAVDRRPARVCADDEAGNALLFASWWTDDTRTEPAGLAAAASETDPAALAAAGAAVSAWSAVMGPRTVLLAGPRSFCAGVERAIEIVERVLAQRGSPVYVRKQIVHNAHVVRDLSGRGAVFVDELDEVPDGATVVFSAHGVSPAVRAEADRRGLNVIDATCPLVTKVHSEARRFADRGDTVVLIGHAGHEETEGTLGEAPGRTVLVETVEDAERLQVPDPSRVSYLTQTTLAVDETTGMIDALRTRFPLLRGPGSDDICYATTNRQQALTAVAADAGLVLVVGSANSSNSLRLVELANRNGTPAQLIDDATDIHPEWLAGVTTVGLTAGASAPPGLVDEVLTALTGLGPVLVEEREVTRETVHFALPRRVG